MLILSETKCSLEGKLRYDKEGNGICEAKRRQTLLNDDCQL